MAEPSSRRSTNAGLGADVLGVSDSAFVLLRDVIERRLGVFFPDDKRDQLVAKLSDVISAQGMTSYLDYYYLLRYDADAERHWAELADRLSVPETFFWRQPDQILACARIIAPAFFERHPHATLRIWSAACCTGEEPLSIAIALAEQGLLFDRRVQIVASDASPVMIDRAKTGLYGERSFRSLPADLRDKYFTKEGSRWRVDPRVHAKVSYSVANLVEPDDVRPLAHADVIFCRNVFIYFADTTITRVARSFADGLADDGYLFIAAAESLTRLATDFALDEIGGSFVYVKARRIAAGRTPSPATS